VGCSPAFLIGALLSLGGPSQGGAREGFSFEQTHTNGTTYKHVLTGGGVWGEAKRGGCGRYSTCPPFVSFSSSFRCGSAPRGGGGGDGCGIVQREWKEDGF
jgi:hypothetical protein